MYTESQGVWWQSPDNVQFAWTPLLATPVASDPSGTMPSSPTSSFGAVPTLTVDDTSSFTFTLRLDDQVGLGVDLMPCGVSGMLFVKAVLPNGAVEAWNRQCFATSGKSAKALVPGYGIVSVNGKTGFANILDECKTSLLLKLCVCRTTLDTVGAYWNSERLPSCKRLM